MIPFRLLLSRLLLVLVSLPTVCLALFGACVTWATWQLGHLPGSRDADVDSLGCGGLAHWATGLLLGSFYLIPLLSALLFSDWLKQKLTWSSGIRRLLLFFLPWAFFLGGKEYLHLEVLDWFFD